MIATRTDVAIEPSRDLRLPQLTLLAMGTMVGAGAFLSLGFGSRLAGVGGLLLALALNGLLALATAMGYAELSSAVPGRGSAYRYARLGFDPGVSFMAGWIEWSACCLAGSLYALTFGVYADSLLRGSGLLNGCPLPPAVSARLLAATAVALLVAGGYWGATTAGGLNRLLTTIVLGLVLVVSVAGVGALAVQPGRVGNLLPFLSDGWGGVLLCMGVTFVAFAGFEAVLRASAETADARHNLPRAMLNAVLAMTVGYVLFTLGAAGLVKDGGQAAGEWLGRAGEFAFREVLAGVLPVGGAVLAAMVVMLATTLALNSTISSATRVLRTMGREAGLPPAYGTGAAQRQPAGLGLLTAAAVIGAGLLLPLFEAALLASVMFLLLFLLVNLCAIRVRRRRGDEFTFGFVMPFFPAIPVAGALGLLALLVGLVAHGLAGAPGLAADLPTGLAMAVSRHPGVLGTAVAGGWLVAGLLLYRGYAAARTAPAEHGVHVIEEVPAANGSQAYRLMVAVAEPKTAVDLIGATYRIGAAKHGQVELLHLVPIPEQVPLDEADLYTAQGREAIAELALYLDPVFPTSTTIRYCRSIARGIATAVRDKRADLLILGWHGQRRNYRFDFGSTIDPIVESAPCPVLIFRGNCNGRFKRILVPLSGGPNAALALNTASMLVDQPDGIITAYHVKHPHSRFDLPAFVAERQARFEGLDERVTVKVEPAADVLAALAAEAGRHDLLVLGISSHPLWHHLARGAILGELPRRCPQPMVLVHAPGGLQSWLRRWF